MLYDPAQKRKFQVTFYTGYRRLLAVQTVIATVYTIHEILAEMALKKLPEQVEREYTRYSVQQGAFMEEGL